MLTSGHKVDIALRGNSGNDHFIFDTTVPRGNADAGLSHPYLYIQCNLRRRVGVLYTG